MNVTHVSIMHRRSQLGLTNRVHGLSPERISLMHLRTANFRFQILYFNRTIRNRKKGGGKKLTDNIIRDEGR